MPRKDKTGPQGEGSMTGRGRGKCNPKDRASAPKGRGGKRSGRRAGKGQRQGGQARVSVEVLEEGLSEAKISSPNNLSEGRTYLQ